MCTFFSGFSDPDPFPPRQYPNTVALPLPSQLRERLWKAIPDASRVLIRVFSSRRGCRRSEPKTPNLRREKWSRGQEGGGTWSAGGVGKVGRNQERTPGSEAVSASKRQPSYHHLVPVTSAGPTCSMSAPSHSPAPIVVRLRGHRSASERKEISSRATSAAEPAPKSKLGIGFGCSPAPESRPRAHATQGEGPEVGLPCVSFKGG